MAKQRCSSESSEGLWKARAQGSLCDDILTYNGYLVILPYGMIF